MTNRQFALSVHILVMLAGADAGCLNSEAMARSANANAVSIRQALARFRDAGYVSSRPGAGGGTQLVRDPARITLTDVWDVVYGEEPILGLHEGDADCPIGCRMQPLLGDIEAGARGALRAELARTTIADIAGDVAASMARAAMTAGA